MMKFFCGPIDPRDPGRRGYIAARSRKQAVEIAAACGFRISEGDIKGFWGTSWPSFAIETPESCCMWVSDITKYEQLFPAIDAKQTEIVPTDEMVSQLKAIAIKHRLTRAEIAMRAGVTLEAVESLFSRRQCAVAAVAAVADALGHVMMVYLEPV